VNHTTGTAHDPIEGLDIYVIGLGGIGDPLIRYLGLFCYGKNAANTIWLIDGDSFELKNRERMGFAEMGLKAYVREAEMANLLGDRVSFQGVPLYITPDNIEELMPLDEPAIIFLCVDNHGTRRLVAEYCQRRTTGLTLLISGGNTSVEEDADRGTRGNVLIHHREDDRDLTNPILTHHPEIADADEDEVPNNEDPDCVTLAMEAGTTQIGLTNLAVASAMLNALYAWYTGELDYEEVFVDVVRNTVVARKRPVLGSRI
jgi:molybdopterin/thiamine biosynthesis adenylyltransferase